MLRHAIVAVPWTRVVLVSALVVVLMEVVARRPTATWLLEVASVGLLAAAAAWCFDEPAAVVVDPAPRTAAWRATARGLGLLPLLGAWSWSMARGWDGFFDRPAQVAAQGVVAVLVGTAWTLTRRAAGVAEPGVRLAPAAVAFALCWPATGRLADHIPLFPFPHHSDAAWDLSRGLWCAAATGAGVVLLVVLTDRLPPVIHRSR